MHDETEWQPELVTGSLTLTEAEKLADEIGAVRVLG